MIELKGRYKTSDRRLDRLPSFDKRSRNFGVINRLSIDKPLVSRSHPSSLWLDQGREGACVSFAFHHEAGAQPTIVKGLTNDTARSRYFLMQEGDEWPGGEYPGASPIYGGTSVLSGAKTMQAAGFFGSYHWAFNIDEAIHAIVYEGGCIFGMAWLDSMFGTLPDGRMDCTGDESGGHAIYARGVILPRNGIAEVTWPIRKTRTRIKTAHPLIRLRNTWWTDWGIDGECLIEAPDLQELAFNRQGECCVPTDRKIPKS